MEPLKLFQLNSRADGNGYHHIVQQCFGDICKCRKITVLRKRVYIGKEKTRLWANDISREIKVLLIKASKPKREQSMTVRQ